MEVLTYKNIFRCFPFIKQLQDLVPSTDTTPLEIKRTAIKCTFKNIDAETIAFVDSLRELSLDILIQSSRHLMSLLLSKELVSLYQSGTHTVEGIAALEYNEIRDVISKNQVPCVDTPHEQTESVQPNYAETPLSGEVET